MTKLCKNCKHFCEFHIDGFVDSFCDRPTPKIDPVYGRTKTLCERASVERLSGQCGMDGKYFEPKQSCVSKIANIIKMLRKYNTEKY